MITTVRDLGKPGGRIRNQAGADGEEARPLPTTCIPVAKLDFPCRTKKSRRTQYEEKADSILTPVRVADMSTAEKRAHKINLR